MLEGEGLPHPAPTPSPASIDYLRGQSPRLFFRVYCLNMNHIHVERQNFDVQKRFYRADAALGRLASIMLIGTSSEARMLKL